jgi:hypothetical protein
MSETPGLWALGCECFLVSRRGWGEQYQGTVRREILIRVFPELKTEF